MESSVWRLLRWVIALGLCALVVVFGVPLAIDAVTRSVVIGEDAGEEEEAAGPSGPVSDGEAEPEADFTVRDGAVGPMSRTELALRDDGHLAVLRFPLIDGAPECVASAELQMSLLEAERTDLAVYAGQLRTFEEGDEVGDPRQNDRVRAWAVTDGSLGRLRWDVTDFYRDWASGNLAPRGIPFVAVVGAADPATVVFASRESDEADAPSLVWEGVPDCGGADDG